MIMVSCASSNKVRKKKTYINDLTEKYRLYGVKDNSYFYFMIDSSGGPHLVKTHAFNPNKVIWIERLQKKN
jgi:hypothetical protein